MELWIWIYIRYDTSMNRWIDRWINSHWLCSFSHKEHVNIEIETHTSIKNGGRGKWGNSKNGNLIILLGAISTKKLFQKDSLTTVRFMILQWELENDGIERQDWCNI